MSMTSAIENFHNAGKNLKQAFEQSKSSWKDEASEQLQEITLEKIDGPHERLLSKMEHLEKLVSQIRRQVNNV
jgi:hypothetical protein